MWKVGTVICFEILFQHFPQETKENQQKRNHNSRFRTEMRIQDLPHTNKLTIRTQCSMKVENV